MWVWGALGEYKSSITRPFGEYEMLITFIFIFNFGNNISKQKLTSAFLTLFIFQDAQLICQ